MYWNNKYNDAAALKNGDVDPLELPTIISVMSNQRCAKVPISDIEAIEQEGRKLHLVTGYDDFICYERIDKVAPLLLNRNFYRPMKSLIINFDRVKEVDTEEVLFVSGQSMTMGKNNLTKLRMAYKRFLKKYPPFIDCDGESNVALVAEKEIIFPE